MTEAALQIAQEFELERLARSRGTPLIAVVVQQFCKGPRRDGDFLSLHPLQGGGAQFRVAGVSEDALERPGDGASALPVHGIR